MDVNAADKLGAILRFLPERDIEGAAGALEYTAAMLAGQAERDAIEAWCYEFAAAGIPFQDWPDMACARVENGEEPDAELRAIRREALAQALVDRGEIETINHSLRRANQ